MMHGLLAEDVERIGSCEHGGANLWWHHGEVWFLSVQFLCTITNRDLRTLGRTFAIVHNDWFWMIITRSFCVFYIKDQYLWIFPLLFLLLMNLEKCFFQKYYVLTSNKQIFTISILVFNNKDYYMSITNRSQYSICWTITAQMAHNSCTIIVTLIIVILIIINLSLVLPIFIAKV